MRDNDLNFWPSVAVGVFQINMRQSKKLALNLAYYLIIFLTKMVEKVVVLTCSNTSKKASGVPTPSKGNRGITRSAQHLVGICLSISPGFERLSLVMEAPMLINLIIPGGS